MKNRLKFAAVVFTAVFALSGITAFAQSEETAEPLPTEFVIEDNRTLTPDGNAQLMDNVTDNENLQFITVTARDGSEFYIIIDKGTQTENVYFLNTVDESDLAALVEDYMPEQTTNQQLEPSSVPDEEKGESEQTEQPKQDMEKSNSSFMFLIVLILVGAAGLTVYYFKVFLPKKKLEQTDDLEDFEFEETETDEENTENIKNG